MAQTRFDVVVLNDPIIFVYLLFYFKKLIPFQRLPYKVTVAVAL